MAINCRSRMSGTKGGAKLSERTEMFEGLCVRAAFVGREDGSAEYGYPRGLVGCRERPEARRLASSDTDRELLRPPSQVEKIRNSPDADRKSRKPECAAVEHRSSGRRPDVWLWSEGATRRT